MLISQGDINTALEELDAIISSCPDSCDEAYYLRGNAFRKLGNWQQALNNYLAAIEINPGSPALQAKNIIIKICTTNKRNNYG